MNYPHAALAVMQAFGQKGCKLVPGLIAVEAMQVNFILRDPAPSAQIAQDVLSQALPQVLGFIATLQSVLQVNATVEAFMQRRTLIGNVLQGVRRGRASAVLDEIGRRQRLNASHGKAKGRLLRVVRKLLLRGFGRGMPVCRQSLAAMFFRCRGSWLAGRCPGFGDGFRPNKLNAVIRRQWLDIGYCRLEGSKVVRVDQIQAS